MFHFRNEIKDFFILIFKPGFDRTKFEKDFFSSPSSWKTFNPLVFYVQFEILVLEPYEFESERSEAIFMKASVNHKRESN